MTTSVSIATDFAGGRGDPRPPLEAIARAGIRFVHWCQRWTGSYTYSVGETLYIKEILQDLKLTVWDIHGTDGGSDDRLWLSPYDFERLEGFRLFENRLWFAQQLGAKTMVLHIPAEPDSHEDQRKFWKIMEENLNGLMRLSRERDVRIAFENTDRYPANHKTISRILEIADPARIGVCFDFGHSNIHLPTGLEFLESVGDRILVVHVNDNRGRDLNPRIDSDIHLLPGDGTVNWSRAIGLLAQSAYDGPLTLEVSMDHYMGLWQGDFLARAYTAGTSLAAMLDEVRETLRS